MKSKISHWLSLHARKTVLPQSHVGFLLVFCFSIIMQLLVVVFQWKPYFVKLVRHLPVPKMDTKLYKPSQGRSNKEVGK